MCDVNLTKNDWRKGRKDEVLEEYRAMATSSDMLPMFVPPFRTTTFDHSFTYSSTPDSLCLQLKDCLKEDKNVCETSFKAAGKRILRLVLLSVKDARRASGLSVEVMGFHHWFELGLISRYPFGQRYR